MEPQVSDLMDAIQADGAYSDELMPIGDYPFEEEVAEAESFQETDAEFQPLAETTLQEAVEDDIQETLLRAVQTETEQPSENIEASEEPETNEKHEEKPEPKPKRVDPRVEVQQLVDQLKQAIQQSETVQWAQEQGRMIDKELARLSAAGIRMTKEEVQTVVQEALQKGVEPSLYFKAYTQDLLLNTLVFGEPVISRPRAPITNETKTPPIPRKTLEERFRDRSGIVSIDYFVAEELEELD